MTVVGAGDVAVALRALPITIEHLSVVIDSVAVDGYYEGATRPSGIAELSGGSETGRGENVDWYPEDQRRFDVVARQALHPTESTVGTIEHHLRAVESPYHRAALEAAAIDLALRQAGTTLFDLADRQPRPVCFCRSLGYDAYDDGNDPCAAVDAVLRSSPDARLKLDVPEAGWSEPVWRRLAETGSVVVIDFKRRGNEESVARAHRWHPEAWIEDPPPGSIRASVPWMHRVALDGYVTCLADLRRGEPGSSAVNIKAPRLGGLLEALDCIELCDTEDRQIYVGGMFEVSVGRRQAQVLASLFCSTAWNDVAPLLAPGHGAPATSPLAVRAPDRGLA